MFGSCSLIERILKNIIVDDNGCWLWMRAKTVGGYGKTQHQGKTLLAHRLAYEVLVGSIPDGMTLDHLCRVRRCVNPGHLEPVTMQENIRRSARCMKAACPSGHSYAEHGTFRPDGRRRCSECDRQKSRTYQRQRRAALC